ncbi:hypothetical protein Tco_0682360 [Tanacetum coccineum]|uniref:Uncharacterized protein n=1 Tax=Tanacetum coccineum TaxID=301880 RepID=A0ABQ4XSI7_9ASTR
MVLKLKRMDELIAHVLRKTYAYGVISYETSESFRYLSEFVKLRLKKVENGSPDRSMGCRTVLFKDMMGYRSLIEKLH